jgi:hypothetical protein
MHFPLLAAYRAFLGIARPRRAIQRPLLAMRRPSGAHRHPKRAMLFLVLTTPRQGFSTCGIDMGITSGLELV